MVVNRGNGGAKQILFIPEVIIQNLFVDLGALRDLVDAGAGLPEQEGRNLTVGIRPEHFKINGNAASVELPVELVEPLGGQTLIEVLFGKKIVTVSLDGAIAIQSGDRIPLSVDPAQLHLFSLENEVRLDCIAA